MYGLSPPRGQPPELVDPRHPTRFTAASGGCATCLAAASANNLARRFHRSAPRTFKRRFGGGGLGRLASADGAGVPRGPPSVRLPTFGRRQGGRVHADRCPVGWARRTGRGYAGSYQYVPAEISCTSGALPAGGCSALAPRRWIAPVTSPRPWRSWPARVAGRPRRLRPRTRPRPGLPAASRLAATSAPWDPLEGT